VNRLSKGFADIIAAHKGIRIMLIFLFKLLITPVFIGTATLAGRRWGPVVNGLLVSLPLTTGPISFILASEYGRKFASKAAAGNLAGQVSMCLFCLTYSLLAQKRYWQVSAIAAIAAFLATTFVLNRVSWQLLPAFITLLSVIALVAFIVPQRRVALAVSAPPRWDLPARMGIATMFVIVLTSVANVLGPQLSGLISTFPIFGVLFAVFTHFQQGPQAASNLLRGIVLGSVAYAAFFLTVGVCLIPLGMALTYLLALLVALLVSGFFYLVTKREGLRLAAK
jgi:hypothetical protein